MGYQGAGDSDPVGPDSDNVARANFIYLTRRWGCVGSLYWIVEKKAPPQFVVKTMDGKEEIWELEANQVGSYKEKMYRRIK